MALQVARCLFTVDEYYQMAAAGILHEDDQVELIEGEILHTAAIGSRHAGCVNRLVQWFFLHVAGQAIVSIQNPIHLNNRSEPEPDMTLLTPHVLTLALWSAPGACAILTGLVHERP